MKSQGCRFRAVAAKHDMCASDGPIHTSHSNALEYCRTLLNSTNPATNVETAHPESPQYLLILQTQPFSQLQLRKTLQRILAADGLEMQGGHRH